MRHHIHEETHDPFHAQGDWTVAIAIAITIAICLAAFIWFFVQLDPYTSDFIGNDGITSPVASPTLDDDP